MTVGEFYAEHRKLIDARKVHLNRVGISAPEEPMPVTPAVTGEPQPVMIARPAQPHVMPSQADVLKMPTGADPPMLDATHAPQLPKSAPTNYSAPKLPKLLGVNVHLTGDGEDVPQRVGNHLTE